MAGYEAQRVARRRGVSLDRRFSAAVALTHFFHLAEGQARLVLPRRVAQVGWTELLPRGIPPAERDKHVAVWSDAANGFYIFGGMSGGGSIASQGPGVQFKGVLG